LHVATGKQKHGEANPPKEGNPNEAGREVYRMGRAMVEPVFGQIKQWRGFRRFSLRGLAKVRGQWKLVCLAQNLLKLFRSGYAVETC